MQHNLYYNSFYLMPLHPVDVYVGKRLRLLRSIRSMSQEVLGLYVGVTFQQIQKYEKGSNRIGASRLYQFAKLFNVNVSSFFEGYLQKGEDDLLAENDKEFLDEKKRLELTYILQNLDPLLQPKIYNFLKSLSSVNNKTHSKKFTKTS